MLCYISTQTWKPATAKTWKPATAKNRPPRERTIQKRIRLQLDHDVKLQDDYVYHFSGHQLDK